MQILQAGKHVLMEKPLAVSEEECQEMIDTAAGNGVRLLVGHTFLFNSSVAKVKDLIKSGSCGDMQYMYAKRTNLGPIRYDVSALWDLATHDISMFLDLAPELEPEWVTCTGASLVPDSDLADVVFVTLGFKDSSRVAHVHASWMDPNKEREVVVVGNSSRIVFSDTEPIHPVTVYFKGSQELQKDAHTLKSNDPVFSPEYLTHARQGDVLKPEIEKVEPLGAQMTEFCTAIRDPSYLMRSDGHFGLKVVHILNSAEASYNAGGSRVML